MAKSIRLSDIDAQGGPLVAPLSRGSYWEHWFDTHSHDKPEAINTLDEHSIWETAINFEILAIEEKKY